MSLLRGKSKTQHRFYGQVKVSYTKNNIIYCYHIDVVGLHFINN